MFNYFKKSIEKFAGDALAKIIYDVLKWLLYSTISIVFISLLPENTTLGSFIKRNLTFTILEFTIVIFLVVLTIFILSFVLFKSKIRKIQSDNFTDELTGLLNHKALREKITVIQNEAKKNNKSLSIIIMDVDNFKAFNEKYSYAKADEILQKLGQLLNKDSRATDTTFRQYMKGDEFIILAVDTDLSRAIMAANRKRTLIASTGFTVTGIDQPVHLTVCCGVTEYNKDSDTPEQLLERANTAMKLAKADTNKNSTRSLV